MIPLSYRVEPVTKLAYDADLKALALLDSWRFLLRGIKIMFRCFASAIIAFLIMWMLMWNNAKYSRIEKKQLCFKAAIIAYVLRSIIFFITGI